MSFDRPRGLPARIIPSAGYQEHCRKDTSIENHLERGEFREASQILEANLQWSLCTHGPEHAMTLDDQEKLALSLRGLGDYAKAANLDRKTLDARSKLQGSENAETLETQHNFALDLFRLKRYEEAAKLDHQTLRVREKMLGPEAPDTLLSRNSLAASLQELGMYKKAYNLNQKTVDIRSKQYKLDHPDLIASRHNLAINLHWLGDLQKSESLLQQNVDILSKGRAPGDRQLAKSIEWLEINRTKQSQAGKRQGDLLRPVNVTASNIPGHKLCSPERKGSKMNIRDGTSADKASLQTVEADKPVLYEQRRENVTQTQILKSSDLSRAPIKTDSQNQGNNAVNLLDMSRSQTTQGSQTQCNNTANNLPPKPSDLLKRPPTSRSQTENNNIVNPPTTKQLQLPKRPTTTGGNTQGNSTDNHPLNKPSELLKKQPKTGSHTESNNIINPPKPSDLPKRPTITGSQMQNDNIINRSKPESLDLLRATTTTDSQMRPKASSDNNLRRKVQTQDISTTRRSSECFQPSTANPREGPERPIVTSRDNVSTTANDQKVYQSEVYSKLCDSKAATEDPYLNDAADKWLELLQQRTQKLLDRHRRQRMKRIKIAILDTGIDKNHPDIAARWSERIKGWRSWIRPDDASEDVSGHGTHAASLLMTAAPEADLYVARIAKDSKSSMDPRDVAQAILHACNEWKVDIVTMSLGYEVWHTAIEEAINHASGQNVLLFAAASNSGANRRIAFPASLSRVICVNSADGGGEPSRYNPPLTNGYNFSAPGEAVPSAWPTALGQEQRKRRSGTSTATPLAAAIAALVLEFANTPGVKISHRDRLHTLEGMQAVFAGMRELKHGYDFLVPWNLLDDRVGSEIVAFRVSDIFNKLCGPEIDSG